MVELNGDWKHFTVFKKMAVQVQQIEGDLETYHGLVDCGIYLTRLYDGVY